MTTPTLPGTIPGLRRDGTPVIYLRTGDRGVILLTPNDGVAVMFRPRDARGPWTEDATPNEIAIDLSDPTGRAHAAWWLVASGYNYPPVISRVVRLSAFGLPMADDEIERLRLVCLHVAGVRP